MSGPSCKIYFSDENEYHFVVKIAAQHDMTLPQYIKACTVKVTNDVIAAQEEYRKREQLKAEREVRQAAEAVTTADAVAEALKINEATEGVTDV